MALSFRPLKFQEANRSTESSGNSGMKIECNGNFQEIGSSFSEILQIRDLLFSASFLGRDHSELNIPRKDDGRVFENGDTLESLLLYVDKY